MNLADSNQTCNWDKPWSTDEIRKNSSNWTLAGDSGLLNSLESVSQKILARSQDVQKEVDSLVQESRATGSQIYNAINDFLMLSNMQFVENRVYDEEVQDESGSGDKKNQVEPQTKEEREAELMPRIREALQLGLNVVETAFEKHHVSDSESDEEHEDHTFHSIPLLKPKDLYVDRPLPYIIGSEKFMQDDFVGLGEMYSDEEEIDDSEKDEINKENEIISDVQETDTDDETDLRHIKTLDESGKSESDDEADLFAPSDDEFDFGGGDEDSTDANSSKSESQTLNNTANFAAELASKLGASQRTDSTIDRNHVTEDSHKNKRKDSKGERAKKDRGNSKLSKRNSEISVVDVDISEDESSPFGQSNKLFASSGGLFDDCKEEENDLFAEITSNSSKESKVRKDSKLSVHRGSKTSSISLFEDDNNDLFVPSRMEAGDEGDNPQKTHRNTKISLFSETDDDEDLFSSASSVPKKKSTADQSSWLFDDVASGSPKDSSSGIDDSQADRSSSESTPRKKLPPGAVSIFGVATSSVSEALKAHRTSLSSDADKDDDWLSSGKDRVSVSRQSTSPKNNENIKKESKSETNKVEKEVKDKEKPKDDIFTSKVEEPKSKVVPRKISLFDDDDDDDEDLFAAPSITTTTTTTPRSKDKMETKPQTEETKEVVSVKSSSSSSSKEVSLFDEDDDSVDLFQTDVKSKKESSPSSKLRTKSLFDEEDALFGGPEEETPSVDLFKVPDVDTNKAKSPVNLFDDSDDSLFSSKSTESKGKPPIPAPRKSSLSPEEPATATEVTLESPKKKPIGGVSLFGGIDPFASKIKRDSTKTENNSKKESTPSNEKSVASSPPSQSTPTPSLVMNVIQNAPEPTTASFEEPPKANTLHTVSKGRAKIQTKRRLPTRKTKRPPSTLDVFGDGNEIFGVNVDETDSKEVKNEKVSKEVKEEKINEEIKEEKINEEVKEEKNSEEIKSETDSKEIKSVENDSEMEKEDEIEKENNKQESVMSPSTEEEDLLPVDELISTKLTPPNISHDDFMTTRESSRSKAKLESDLFGDLNSGDDDLFTTRPKKPSEPVDDIFSSASKVNTKTNILSDDDDDLDDLFAIPKKIDNKKKSKPESLFETESDSDDIFADLQPKKQTKQPTLATQTKKETKTSLFDDDDGEDDNIFNDPLMVKSSK